MGPCSTDEVKFIQGRDDTGKVRTVQLTPDDSACANWAFDVTPARLVSALITERGVCGANEQAITAMYHDLSSKAQEK